MHRIFKEKVQALPAQGFDKIQPVEFGQIDVEKNHVDRFGMHHVERADGVGAHVGEREEGGHGDVFFQDFGREGLVFHDQAAQGSVGHGLR